MDFFDFRKRGENNLVGLRNQGATCYLNSLVQVTAFFFEGRISFIFNKLQVMFMTPELKRGLYELNLSEDLGVVSVGGVIFFRSPFEMSDSG